MPAYEEIHLPGIQRDLAAMLECAVYGSHMDGDAFFCRFLHTRVAAELERGGPVYLGQGSGAELVQRVMYFTTGECRRARPFKSRRTTPEYWAGKTLAYYQWYSGRRFRDIHEVLPFSKVVTLYPAMRDEDTSKFVAYAEERINAARQNPLKKHRERRGLSREELAQRSGVLLTDILAYEEKDGINRAPLEQVYQLANALLLDMEMLLES